MSTKYSKSLGQRIIALSELPRKKYFFWSGFVGAFPMFAIFYLLSPILKTKIGDPSYDLLAFSLSALISALFTTFFVSCSLDYMKYSPKVYGAVTNRTYVALAKNRFVKGILGLFTNSVEVQLNSIWNKRGKTIDEHTEQLAGHEYRFEEHEKRIHDLEKEKDAHNQEIRTLYREIGERDKVIFQLKSELDEYKKKDSVKKQQIGERIDAQDINENTKIDDEDTKFKPRD